MKTTEQLKALAEKATPGPWKKSSAGEILYQYPTGGFASLLCCLDEDCGAGVKANVNEADTGFIVAANPATIKELCELVEMMEEALVSIYDRHNADTMTVAREALARVAKFQKGE